MSRSSEKKMKPLISTPLRPLPLPASSATIGLQAVWGKDESTLPTGTWKDRRSQLIVREAKRKGKRALALISAGNAAVSLAHFAAPEGIKIYVIVDSKTPCEVITTLKKICDGVVEFELDSGFLSEELQKGLIAKNLEIDAADLWCVSEGFEEAYEAIAKELKEVLPQIPDTIIVPSGSREAMVGIVEGCRKIGWKKTKVVGVTCAMNRMLHTRFVPENYQEKTTKWKEKNIAEVVISERTDEEALRCIPADIRAEAAPAHAFAWFAGEVERGSRTFGKTVVIVNSGYGKLNALIGYSNLRLHPQFVSAHYQLRGALKVRNKSLPFRPL
ncbi:MAG: PLP-dependent lyase/thiolase [Candidatus Peregrinibacteria bacterium]